jgi:hypothetical protein
VDSHVEQKARDAVRALEELRRAAFDACNGTEASPNAHEEFELAWSPTMSADELAEQALASATECLSEYQTFRLGCVYCYGCRSASCEHAQPSEPGQVFAGYQSTGRPYWEEFFNFLLAIDDERTDQLFASRPQILSRVVGRKRLTAEQLDSFGRDSLTYRIWGEVVAGYLDVDGTRMAMSVQVVENKAHQLRLQTIAPEGLHAALVDTPESARSAFHRVHEALGEARNSLIETSHIWEAHHGRKRLKEAREKVFSVLRHLAHSIERKGRQRIRRTAHAEQRGNEQRPVHAAREDIAQAAKGDFYRDQFRNSIIVTGKSGRAHAFNDEGRHITSFVLQGDELDRRLQRNRYKPLDDAERNAFRQRVTQGEAEAPRQRPTGRASR